MMYDQSSHAADVRPKRDRRPPAWFADYAVAYPNYDQNPPLAHTTFHAVGAQEYHDGAERVAEMDPFALHPLSDEASATPRQRSQTVPLRPQYQSTPVPPSAPAPEATSVILEAIKQLQEDNQRLHYTVIQMQRQLNTSATRSAALSPPPGPSALHQSALLRPVPGSDLPPPPPPHQLQSTSATAGVLKEEGDWPLPPPPHEAAAPEPVPVAAAHSHLVEELTEHLKRMGMRPGKAPIATPEYFDADAGSDGASVFSLPVAAREPIARPAGTSEFRPQQEPVYRGPKPSIPFFTKGDPREFTRLKIALDNLLPADSTERFKYQILVDHLKFEEALLIADSYTNSRQPYSDTMASLTEHYGQPHQMALRRIAELMEAPSVRTNDTSAFKRFALRVRALVGMLDQLGENGHVELQCGSHVSRLLLKLPQDMRAEFKRYLYPQRIRIPTLLHFAEWLEYELKMQETVFEVLSGSGKPDVDLKKDKRTNQRSSRPTNVLHGADQAENSIASESTLIPSSKSGPERQVYCPFCSNSEHYLNQCTNFNQLTTEQKSTWVKTNKKCWRCGRAHQAAKCRLKITCKKCRGKHLDALHDVNSKPAPENSPETKENDVFYLDRRSGSSPVMLKVSKVILRNGKQTVEAYAILDDGSERTILLAKAAQALKLVGQPENLALRTVRQDMTVIQGSSVSFSISPACQPHKIYKISGAFTADQLGLAEHTYPVKMLQRKYRHLKGLPLQAFSKVQPVILIGSDYPHLITPTEPVRLGPPGGPAAVKTRLGWTLQGPTRFVQQQLQSTKCLHVSIFTPSTELLQHVERLWQLDVMPYRSEKVVSRSRQDQEAIDLLEKKTVRIEVEGTQRYGTPLLRVKNMPKLQAPKEAVLSHLRSTERRLARDPERAAAYCAEIQKLEQAGYVVKVKEEELETGGESWYIPHHMVSHNGKNRIVFNCSFTYKGANLNDFLLPGPTLTSSLLGVLLRFREHSIAISSDIRGMFHQVRLLPEDKALLRFLWRDLQRDTAPSIYEWQVLPFGTTCSPCCATFALRKHALDHSTPGEDVRVVVERCFYVDNCLRSVPSKDEAVLLVNKLQLLLADGGFELRQWASNTPETISHLPKELRSESSELWLNQSEADPQELALGLRWFCHSDTLGYKCRLQDPLVPTMRNIYRVLASLYDPLGFIIPFTTRAKTLVQGLWSKPREWDDPDLPEDALMLWTEWERELEHLSQISLPRCYVSIQMDSVVCTRTIHVFCDASERAYGSVAYLHTEDQHGRVEVSFLTARSRVAPKKQQSMPRLELCAALTGAQLAALLQKELTLPLQDVVLWTDSTTVLTWIQSESCRFKIFVGMRVAEIQELTSVSSWRYVDSARNPADDITRGKTLLDLAKDGRWKDGPAFLQQPTEFWPTKPSAGIVEEEAELRKPVFCSYTTTPANPPLPDPEQFSSFREMVQAVALSRHGAAAGQDGPTADGYREIELELLRQAQHDSFAEDLALLAAGKPVTSTSRLITLAPEYDKATRLIRVGGRLRYSEHLEAEAMHPLVLDPAHKITRLLIHDVDKDLCHPGSERLFAEIRRRFWILHGREAVKRHQHSCPDCKRWRALPTVPKMANLPQARLRLFKPPFFSTGVDCFGPFTVNVGRRSEKRWGILFKCLTTRAVHIDILASLDTGSFLMALRRFVARRGKPAELLSDQGTNFKGGERELHEAFQALCPSLREKLSAHQISFKFNPPGAPHFGGIWEREIRSVKAALYATIQPHAIQEEVLRTVLIEVEGILNSKPLGYVSSDVADPDPVTPNLLLMGRLDPSLPQVVYEESELLSRKRWKHSQILADQFWTHFIKHYLPALQTRSKWQTDTPDLQQGSIVMVVDPSLPRAQWPVGRVTKVHPGADGRIRTAEVDVNGRQYQRPVARLITLPAIPDMDPEPSRPSNEG